MLDFHKPSPSEKEQYETCLRHSSPRGCEYSFANLRLWGRQQIAFRHGCAAFFSHFQGRSVYPFPIGSGDKQQLIREILMDAAQRGIPCRITGMTDDDRALLESWFPGVFRIRTARDSFDYVYAIDDLADLRGRKYQKKRNHFNRFQATHPDYQVLPLTQENLDQAKLLAEHWYTQRSLTDPMGDYLLERIAIDRAFRHFQELDLVGCILVEGSEVLAMTMASRLSEDTFDVHFEKAREDVDGAYAAINCEFARYLRLKYPEIRFLNREDDMGLEGLRKAKLSYLPHHLVQKHWACLEEDLHGD